MPRLALAIFVLSGTAWGADFDWNIPPGFPKPPVPANNPMNAAKVELGRSLFYDKRMSVNGKQSCGSCHRQDLAFTDGRARAQGTTGEFHPRGSMSLANVGYIASLTWANPAMKTLEEQALVPMLGEHPIELGLKGNEQRFLDTIRADVKYRDLFARAFPEDQEHFTLGEVTKAIAAFERTIISLRSPYDAYRWGGDAEAISESAKRGEIIFYSSERGRCFQCHAGWNFGSSAQFDGGDERERNTSFFNTGVSAYEEPNRGIFEQTKEPQDIGKFRAPSLRNIAVTAPYMHDGSLATLDGVIEHYAAGGRMAHANKSRILRPLNLSAQDKADLIEFLKSLTDETLLHDRRWSDPWPVN